MAKKINEQYDEIFKIVGEKVGFRNFNYKDYLNLKEKKSDDTRLKNFDKYIEENLPFKESTDEDFIGSINILNNGLREEDKVTDSKSFFKVGDLIPKKDEERKASKPLPTKTEVKKEKKTSLFKRITKNIPAGAIGASVVSVGLSALTLMLGSYAGWPAAAMLGTFNVTFVIPQAIILSYVGIKYLSKKIKDGSVKRWFENRKNKKLERELEKTKAKEKEFEKVSSELFPTTKSFDDVVRESSKEETSGVASEPLPDSFKFVPPVPVLEKPKKEKKIDDASEDSIETEFVDKEPIDSGSEEETPIPDDVKKEEATTDKVELPVKEENSTEENNMQFSPRRQMVINDLDNSLTNYSSNTEHMIQQTIQAKKDLTNFRRSNTRKYNRTKKDILAEFEAIERQLEFIKMQTEPYTKIYDSRIKETKEYKEAMREREIAERKLQELKEKKKILLSNLENDRLESLGEVSQRQQEIDDRQKEISKRQKKYETNADLLQTLLIKPEEKSVEVEKREVQDINGENKTIYIEQPHRYLSDIIPEEEITRRK